MLHAKKYNIGDQIPVDYVANAAIIAAAANANKNQLKVMHVGSSDLNPVNWDLTEPACTKYWALFPAQKK